MQLAEDEVHWKVPHIEEVNLQKSSNTQGKVKSPTPES